jgi:S-adenosylmethionine decarboxylase
MNKVLVHKHIIIRAEVLDPIINKTKSVKFLRRMIKAIGMKAMYGPVASYSKMPGNKGLTAFAIIETSHIAMHIWDETNPALVQLDVYTCGPFEPQSVLDLLQELKPTKVEFKYLDREKGFTELTI